MNGSTTDWMNEWMNEWMTQSINQSIDQINLIACSLFLTIVSTQQCKDIVSQCGMFQYPTSIDIIVSAPNTSVRNMTSRQKCRVDTVTFCVNCCGKNLSPSGDCVWRPRVPHDTRRDTVYSQTLICITPPRRRTKLLVIMGFRSDEVLSTRSRTHWEFQNESI